MILHSYNPPTSGLGGIYDGVDIQGFDGERINQPNVDSRLRQLVGRLHGFHQSDTGRNYSHLISVTLPHNL